MKTSTARQGKPAVRVSPVVTCRVMREPGIEPPWTLDDEVTAALRRLP